MDPLALRWWTLLIPQAGDEGIEKSFADLVRRYREPARHYHTLAHVRSVVVWIDVLWPDAPSSLLFAGFLHDVIYDPRAADNEQRSAEFAGEALAALGVEPATRQEAARLILLTRTHRTTPDDQAGSVLLDADLAILAAAEPDYDAYAAAIRREYAWVPEADYHAGRRQILERFLARPRLYFTAKMRADAETPARANLAREILRLGERDR